MKGKRNVITFGKSTCQQRCWLDCEMHKENFTQNVGTGIQKLSGEECTYTLI